MTAPPRKTLLTTIIAISVAAATAGCATTDADVTTPSSASNTSIAAPSSPSSRRSKYADDTYNAAGQYGSLPSSIGVSVTLVAVVGLAVLIKRGWRMALVHTVPLGAIFGLWWLT